MTRRDKPGHRTRLNKRSAEARVKGVDYERRLCLATRREGRLWVGLSVFRFRPDRSTHDGVILSRLQAERLALWILKHTGWRTA